VTELPVELVESPPAFAALLERLQDQTVVGIDTEAASFHRYKDRVYLLQLSSRTHTAVVDPLAVDGLPGLGAWLARDTTEFVFHDGDYDLRLLRLEFGFRVARLFDTRIAAQFLGEPSVGLAAQLERRFGVETDKRLQRADWSSRPLTPEMVRYAATDTRYLPALRDAMRDELERIGRLEWVAEECALLSTVEWPAPEPAEQAFLRLKGARALDRRGLAVLRELYVWRELAAVRTDRPLFRILGTEALLAMAAKRPRTAKGLESIRGVGRETAARRGAQLLEAIERGLAVPDRDLPAFQRAPRFRSDPEFEALLARLKTWRAGLAERLGLPAGLLAPNAILELAARKRPATLAELASLPNVRRWQVSAFGDELLGVLRR